MRFLLVPLTLGLALGCGGDADSDPRPRAAEETFDTVTPTERAETRSDAADEEPPPATPPSGPMAVALRDLTSEVPRDRAEAVQVFVEADVDESLRDKAAARLIPLLTDPDPDVVTNAATALRKWARPEDVRAIAGLVDDQDSEVRHAALRVLGAFPTPTAAQAVASRIRSAIDRQHAKRALLEMGSVAEPPLLALVEEADNPTQLAIVEVLHEVGTQESLETLIDLQMDDGNDVAIAAARAIDAVNSR